MLACAFAIYGLATIAHGSGFVAVFLAGIALGDVREPYRREVEHFHTALAGLAEIVAFIVFGLSVDLDVLGRTDVWVPGLVIGAGLALVVRPLAVPPCLIGSGLRRNEVGFIVFAGLKGAVPLLLGRLVLASGVADGARSYGIVVVSVLFSVIVQGSLVPSAAGMLRVPMTRREA
jgi:cell volume regulation protein A